MFMKCIQNDMKHVQVLSTMRQDKQLSLDLYRIYAGHTSLVVVHTHSQNSSLAVLK